MKNRIQFKFVFQARQLVFSFDTYLDGMVCATAIHETLLYSPVAIYQKFGHRFRFIGRMVDRGFVTPKYYEQSLFID